MHNSHYDLAELLENAGLTVREDSEDIEHSRVYRDAASNDVLAHIYGDDDARLVWAF